MEYYGELYGSDEDLIRAVMCRVKESAGENLWLLFTKDGWDNFEHPWPSLSTNLLNHALGNLKRMRLNGNRVIDGAFSSNGKIIVAVNKTKELSDYLENIRFSEDERRDAEFIEVEEVERWN